MGLPLVFYESNDHVCCLIKQLYEIEVDKISKLNGYDDVNLLCESSKNGLTSRFVCKITDPTGSAEENILESMNEALLFCVRKGIQVPEPLMNVNRQYLHRMCFNDGKTRAIRLLKFVPGQLLVQVPMTKQLWFEGGVFVKQFSDIFSQFQCEPLKKRHFYWALANCVDIRKQISAVDTVWHEPIEQILKDFESKVLQQSHRFVHSVIHGDINEQNLIVQQENDEIISSQENADCQNSDPKIRFALIDFGDIHYAPAIFELAIFCAYALICYGDSGDLTSVKYILEGVRSVGELPSEELKIIPICVKARLCQSLVLGAYAASLNPENKYVLSTAKKGWSLLQQLCRIKDETLLDMWTN